MINEGQYVWLSSLEKKDNGHEAERHPKTHVNCVVEIFHPQKMTVCNRFTGCVCFLFSEGNTDGRGLRIFILK